MTSKAHPLTLPALDPAALPARLGSAYPAPFAAAVAGREKRALGAAAGLTRYGVNLVRLPPGAASSQRHCHSGDDVITYPDIDLMLRRADGDSVFRHKDGTPY